MGEGEDGEGEGGVVTPQDGDITDPQEAHKTVAILIDELPHHHHHHHVIKYHHHHHREREREREKSVNTKAFYRDGWRHFVDNIRTSSISHRT